jgi:chromosome segregation ATPase
MEMTYLKEQLKCQNQDIKTLNEDLQETKDRCNFLRSKNQELQELNFMLKKYLNSKKPLLDDFKDFYKEDLIAENQHLRAKILSLNPYNDTLALECGTLRRQVQEL